MIRHHLKRHKYKVVVGVPMVVLLASSLSFIRSPEEICIVPDDNRYVEVGEQVTLHVMADTDEPFNVIGATIQAPADLISIDSVSKEKSIIDLWSEEPTIEDASRLVFSGGIVSESGFLGNGIVLTLHLTPLSEGTAEIVFEEVQMLAHDGTGREIGCGDSPITLFVRPTEYPTPDVNGDKHVNLFDFGIVSARLFRSYERAYDLNLDGKITLADIGIVISQMGNNGRLGSLALLSY